VFAGGGEVSPCGSEIVPAKKEMSIISTPQTPKRYKKRTGRPKINTLTLKSDKIG
jgi:hypothetical protein